MPETVLQVDDLKTYFFTEAGVVRAVDGVSFSLAKGRPLGLVGESGSGKTVTALSVLGVVPRPGRIVSGRILFEGENLLEKTEEEMRGFRGKRIGYVSQDPNSSLDPLFTVGNQLSEVVTTHEKMSKEAAREKVVDLLRLVRIPEPETRMRAYPHELSGGRRQRIAIARALASEPGPVTADETTPKRRITSEARRLELLRGAG